MMYSFLQMLRRNLLALNSKLLIVLSLLNFSRSLSAQRSCTLLVGIVCLIQRSLTWYGLPFRTDAVYPQ